MWQIIVCHGKQITPQNGHPEKRTSTQMEEDNS